MLTKTGFQVLRDFADQYRLKVGVDECGDPVIRGRFGSIYEQDGKLAVCLEFSRRVRQKLRVTCQRKRRLLRYCSGVDPEVLIEGDEECIILTTLQQVEFLKEAIRVLGIKKSRRVSDKTANHLRALAQKRRRTTLEGHLEGQI